MTTSLITARPPRLSELLHPERAFLSFWRNRLMIRSLIRHDIERQYRGLRLGFLWTLLKPLFILAIYTLVFGLVFNAQWPESDSGRLGDTALIIFCGLTIFTLFTDCLNAAPELILNHPNYVKRVVFPVEILALVQWGSTLFHSLVQLGLLVIADFLFRQHVSPYLLWVPVLLVPYSFFILGVVWLISSAGVFLRDLSQFLGPVTTALFFITPLFYSAEMVPESVRAFLLANPLAWFIDQFRGVLLWDRPPTWLGVGIATAGGFLFMCVGYANFMRLKRRFADVI